MRFRDELDITVKAGDGGNGKSSFRREKYIPKGGPDGGDGGKGGDVVLEADTKLMSLEGLATQQRYVAESGASGGGSKMSGRGGSDLVLKVPVGTLIKDPERGNVLKDLDAPGARIVIAVGGWGGRGNARFATPTDRVPTKAETGKPGEERSLRLELKTIADIGLIGFPNAGKSTLLAALSHARPKVGGWAFTTLSPNVGIVEFEFEPYVVADVPGLIEGASRGKGLGDRFLRHVERTRVLLHLVDASDPEAVAPAYRAVRAEIRAYSEALAAKPEIVVFTKLDLVVDGGDEAPSEESGRARLAEVARELGVTPILCSAASGEGIEDVKREMVARVKALRGTAAPTA